MLNLPIWAASFWIVFSLRLYHYLFASEWWFFGTQRLHVSRDFEGGCQIYVELEATEREGSRCQTLRPPTFILQMERIVRFAATRRALRKPASWISLLAAVSLLVRLQGIELAVFSNPGWCRSAAKAAFGVFADISEALPRSFWMPFLRE